MRLAIGFLLVAIATVAGGGCDVGPGGARPPTVVAVTTPEQALAAVIAAEPRLAGIQRFDPELIGQGSWVKVSPASGVGAFVVEVKVGWGDCPAGCIHGHTWTLAVAPDGAVSVIDESGEPVPDDAWPAAGGAS